MKKILLALAATATIAGYSAQAEAAKLKVCFIYVGTTTDGGWTQAHDKGRKELEAALGKKIKTLYLENIPENADAKGAMEKLARKGCGLIFATSFGYMEQTLKVAAEFPKVKFDHATGYKAAANMGTYNSRFYEGRYIEGQLAAKMSKTGTAAYIASFPIPEVIQGVDAFELGARSINPKFKLKVIWVNTWFDPGKEADAAKAAIDQGVDIITQHTDSTAPVQVAEERKVFTFGQSSDMIKAGPHVQLTAVIDNWGPYYIRQTQAALDGTWKPEQSWDGINKGNVVIAPFTNMPADIVKMAEDTKSKISSGELKPFTGPVNKQDGTPWLKAGESAGDDVLGGLNFFVEGVEGSVPK